MSLRIQRGSVRASTQEPVLRVMSEFQGVVALILIKLDKSQKNSAGGIPVMPSKQRHVCVSLGCDVLLHWSKSGI